MAEQHDSRGLRRLALLCQQLQPSTGLQLNPTKGTDDSQRTAIICGGVVLDVQACPASGLKLLKGGSVPGRVYQVPGGVGRNIAACVCQLAPLDRPAPLLAGVLGADGAGDMLRASLQRSRLDLSCLTVEPSASTPCVTMVMDSAGQVEACVADVAAVEVVLTPSSPLISQLCTSVIPSKANLLVVDANLGPATLTALCQAAKSAGVPVVFEPVSVPKAVRGAGALGCIAWVKPNAGELVALADAARAQRGLPPLARPAVLQHVEDQEAGGQADAGGSGSSPGAAGDAQAEAQARARLDEVLSALARFAAVLLSEGTQRVLLTLGSQGAALMTSGPGGSSQQQRQQAAQQQPGACSGGACSRPTSTGPCSPIPGASVASSASCSQGQGQGVAVQEVHICHLPALPAKVASANGAGDTLVGGLVGALLQGVGSDEEAAAYGMAAAKASVESADNVPSGLSMQLLRPGAQAVLRGARRFVVAV